jgi:hypothetical protein
MFSYDGDKSENCGLGVRSSVIEWRRMGEQGHRRACRSLIVECFLFKAPSGRFCVQLHSALFRDVGGKLGLEL